MPWISWSRLYSIRRLLWHPFLSNRYGSFSLPCTLPLIWAKLRYLIFISRVLRWGNLPDSRGFIVFVFLARRLACRSLYSSAVQYICIEEGLTMGTGLPPQYLGKYELQQQLGRGGMAEVWKALDTQLQRYVAIKILHTNLQNDPDFIKRFLREARPVASLHHPNIVQIYDFQIFHTH